MRGVPRRPDVVDCPTNRPDGHTVRARGDGEVVVRFIARRLAMLEGVVLVVVASFLTDAVQAALDPRVRV
jgi:hypothetical protein